MKLNFFVCSVVFSAAFVLLSGSPSKSDWIAEPVQETVGTIDSASIFKLLKSEHNEPEKILRAVDSSFAKYVASEGYKIRLMFYHKDFTGDTTREIVLHFHNSAVPFDRIYVLTKESKHYSISEPFGFGAEGAYDDEWARIDFKIQCILVRERTWGTCFGGYDWSVTKFVNGEFKKVLYFVGEHGHSTCGTEDPEISWNMQSTHAFYNRDSLLFTGIIEHTKYKDNANDEPVLLERELVDISFIYRYDHVRDTFIPFSKKGVQLSKNPAVASDFWDLYLNGEF